MDLWNGEETLGIAFHFYRYLAQGAPTHLEYENPIQIKKTEPGVFLVDFGRVAFGNIRLMPRADATGQLLDPQQRFSAEAHG